MFKTNLLHMLIALIALQSTIAVADLHKPHQSGTNHIEFDESHDHDSRKLEVKKESNKDSNLSSDIQYDCHHCCHCHGVTQLFMATNSSEFRNYDYDSQYSRVTSNYKSLLISPALRPPIV